MIALLLPILGKLLPYLVVALGALGAIWRYGSKQKEAGRQEEVQAVTKVNQTAQAEIAKNAEDNAGLDDAALDRKLSNPDPNHP